MKKYQTEQLRNVSLISHSGAGKTSLTEALLYGTGATTRLGSVEERSTVSDYDPEEQERQMSVNTSVVPCEVGGYKVNVLDTPGYMDFVGEVKGALRVSDGAVVVICAYSGVEVGTEMVWQYADQNNLPRIVFINKMDRENASFQRALEQMRGKFEKRVIPLQLPVGAQANFRGVIDLVSMKAYLDDKRDPAPIPADLQKQAETMRQELIEAAAEADDELIVKYLDGEELTPEQVAKGIRAGVKSGAFIPVMCGSATLGRGVAPLLQAIIAYLPSPAEKDVVAKSLSTSHEEILKPISHSPLAALVFKTLADPFVGKMTYFRVFSGDFASDSRAYNASKGEEERIGQAYFLRGKEQIATDSVPVGDIGIVTKLQYTATGDTLCQKDHAVILPGITYPLPIFEAAVFPKTKADLDKLGNALARLVDEDPTLRLRREQDTGEMIISGMGDSHVDIAVKRLQRKFGVQVVTEVPRVPYKETVTKTAQAQGRHKKQTGGRGQFGDTWLRIEPLAPNSGFEFADEVFGGARAQELYPLGGKGSAHGHPVRHLGRIPGH